jgi:4-hydroxy-3-polyprenylbenzoate decarboxylase
VPYADLREYLAVLDSKNLLKRISRSVDKSWEIAAVARVAFQRIKASERPALMFTNIQGHTTPLVLGVLGGSPAIYAASLQTEVENIPDVWRAAREKPIAPRLVETGPVKENILTGAAIDLERFPSPVWTIPHDPAPYLTATYVATRDPETGKQNLGTYRCEVKGPRELAMWVNFTKDARRHVEIYGRRGERAPVAIVMGADPAVGHCSVTNLPYGVDELAVAGGLRGAPVDVVKCESHDLVVPATAEIVIEGFVRHDDLVPEGPFGEYTGYMGPDTRSYRVELACVTHRNDPIYQAFLSQMPPSESSCIRQVGREAALLHHLVRALGLPVTGVHLPEAGAAAAFVVIAMRNPRLGQARQAVLGSIAHDPSMGKFTIVVDDDIDIRDPEMVNWAMSFRVQPAQDVWIVPDVPAVQLDPSQAPAEVQQLDPRRKLSSKLAIDATKKHAYPANSMPPKEHVAEVAKNWALYWGNS